MYKQLFGDKNTNWELVLGDQAMSEVSSQKSYSELYIRNKIC